MKTVSLSEAKTRFSGLLDAVQGRGEEIMITRNGPAAAALVSPRDFESWKETAAVRADAELVAELRRGGERDLAAAHSSWTMAEMIVY